MANQMMTVALSNSSATAPVNIKAWTCTNGQYSNSGCNSKKAGTCTYTVRAPGTASAARLRVLISALHPFCPPQYYRTVAFLSAANLQVQLPGTCSSGPCTPSGLVATGCSLVYAPSSQIVITQAQYNADGGSCASLGQTTFAPSIATPTFNIRSTADPYQLAMGMTNCAGTFGPTAKSFRVSGIGLLIAGVLITALTLTLIVKKFCFTPPQQPQQQQIPSWEMQKGPFPTAPQQQLPPSYAPGGYAPQQQQQYAPQPGYAPQQPQGYGQPQQGGYAQPGYAPQQGYGQPQQQYAPQPGAYAPPQAAPYGQQQYSNPAYTQY